MPSPKKIIQQDVHEICLELKETLGPLSGTTLLVTGGSGFLCSYLLETVAHLNDRFFDQPCRLITVDNLRSGVSERTEHLVKRPDFRFIDHDISEPLDFEEPVHWIVHGAGIASPTFYRRYPLETIDVNVTGTRLMLEFARLHGVRSLLYLSTSEIYGDPDPEHIPTREDYRGYVSCTGPRACYDESKRLAETLCATYYSFHKTPVKVMRPFNVYGPGQRLDDRRIMPDLISAALDRRPLVLFSDGRATRTLCYVTDAIRAMWHVLMSQADGEAFNVGNDEGEITMGGLAEQVRDAAGPPHIEIRHRISDDAHYLTDNPQRRSPDLTKLRSQFPWAPKVPLAEGVKRTLLSYQAAEHRGPSLIGAV
jgi:dTDP-glucose 4,6-dehydratase/UDP-glucuronate decarboxylase